MSEVGKVLILGSNGMVGTEMVQVSKGRKIAVATAARDLADYCFDFTDQTRLQQMIAASKPAVIINCAGKIDIAQCEHDAKVAAWQVNAVLPERLTRLMDKHDFRLVHISTDHFFTTGGNKPHSEDDPVQIVNEYAASKYVGELYARSSHRSLVLRSCIHGFSSSNQKPNLIAWLLAAINQDQPITLFNDAYCSGIDVNQFCNYVFDLIAADATGLINVAASQVYSKADFALEVIRQLGQQPGTIKYDSIKQLTPVRAPCLGLTVTKLSQLLNCTPPNLPKVVTNLINRMPS